MGRYIVKKEFEFYVYDGHMPVKVKEGNLVSYEIYTREPGFDFNNAVKITVHNPDGDITLDGPNKLYLGEYLREIEYNDLVHPKEYMFEQQKDRTYRHGVTKNYGFVDNLDKVIEDDKDEANYNKRINTAAVLNYFHKIIESNDSMDNRVFEWIESEKERLNNEMKRLDVLTATDEDIIQTALTGYYQEHYSSDVEIANKITDVRNRYLEMLNPKGE